MAQIEPSSYVNIRKNYILDTFKNILKNLFQDKLFISTVIIIYIKSILFIGFLGTNKATGINLAKGFFSIPPYLLYLSFILLVLSISFLFKGRAHLWSLIILDMLVSLLLLSDIWYYRGFSGFLNVSLFFKGWNVSTIMKGILSVVKPIDLILVIDILPIIFYISYNNRLYKGVSRSIPLFLLTFILSTCYLTYIHYKVDIYDRCFYGQTAFLQSWAPTQTMSNLGPVGYHIFDSYLYVENSRPYVLSKNEENNIETWYDENIENLPDNKYAGMLKGKNLLVIQVESLENFVINQKVQGQEITPTLNKLLKNSLYFNNYHENVYNGVSSDSDLLTNTGIYPIRSGSTFFRYPNNEYKNSLPNILRSMGYSTTAIHPDKGSFWNWVSALDSIGFQRCIDSTYFKSTEPIGLGLSDNELMTQTSQIIEKGKSPFYTFMVTQSSHGPFDLPDKYRQLKLDEELYDNILGDYLQSIRYVDNEIGKFLDELDSKGILENTVVVIYGDHTGVHKFYPDELSQVKAADDSWTNNDMEIPLIIYNPSVKGETFDIQGGQIDLMPTLSYLLGVNKEKYQREAQGKILVNTSKKYTIMENLDMYGEYTDKDKQHAQDGISLSDIMIRSNYFKVK